MGMNSPCVNCGADSKVCKECGWYNGVWIPKDQYEAKLKANMVAMLTEIQLEIEELQGKFSPYYDEASQHTSYIIQQKINALKGE